MYMYMVTGAYYESGLLVVIVAKAQNKKIKIWKI